jgi:hypothetical protein
MLENRFDPVIRPDFVKEVLPEYFTGEYPNIITFLESYYEFMDSADNFGDLLKDLYTIRDMGSADLNYIDNLFQEIGLGISQSFFTNPREVIRNFANFFRVKGSVYSARGFFRAFFESESELVYPKTSIFTIGESGSTIGPESGKVLQDGKVYQILSVLIKSEVSIKAWENLYKRYVHPAGFYLSSELNLNSDKKVPVKGKPVIAITEPVLRASSGTSGFRVLGSSRVLKSDMGSADLIVDSDYGMILLDDSSYLETWAPSVADAGSMYEYSQLYDSDIYRYINLAALNPDITLETEGSMIIDSFGKTETIYNWIKLDSSYIFDINNFNFPDNQTIRLVQLSEISRETILDIKDAII